MDDAKETVTNRVADRAESTETTTERINAVASGDKISGVVIYWDSTAIGNEGPAYRDGDESGALEFEGWNGDIDGTENDTYHVSNYFGADGKYLGPDRHGIYPEFKA